MTWAHYRCASGAERYHEIHPMSTLTWSGHVLAPERLTISDSRARPARVCRHCRARAIREGHDVPRTMQRPREMRSQP